MVVARLRDALSEALLELFVAAGRLKSERRKGWVLKLGIDNPESVAEHSFRMALMSMVYSDMRGLDTARVMKMALLHDLPEAIVGDSVPGEISRRRKREGESAAMEKILGGLPAERRGEYESIWSEFLRGRSQEARLVRQLDKLEMAIQAREYEEAGAGPGTGEFMESARAGIQDEDLLALLRLVSKDL